ncbi:hypothetical protein D3C79_994000 [compost metagenome]
MHQGLTRALKVYRPGLGQGHAPGGALEQAHAKLALQMGDGLGDRRRRLAQLIGRTAEAAVFGGGDENGQGRHFVHGFFLFGTSEAMKGTREHPHLFI